MRKADASDADAPEVGALDADHELMRRVQEGDDAAFEVLVHKYQGLVLALARKYLGSRYAGIDDVGQQVFVRIYRGKHTWRPTARVKTWIYSITVNACLNEIRHLKSAKERGVRSFTAAFGGAGDASDGERERGHEDASARSPGAPVEEREVAERVRAAVDRLPEQQRLALVLVRFHGCSYDDVAATMNTTVPAVKSLLTRARDHLKRLLGDLVEAAGEPAASSGRKSREPDDAD
jgi:RNA polymerase sigma-70 factor (ECF subfamily)